MTDYDQMTDDQKFLKTITGNSDASQLIMVCLIGADAMLFLILLKVFNLI